MDRDPKLDPPAIARFDASLKALEALAPELAGAMRKNLELRMRRVETTELSAPFRDDDLRAFFDPGEVRVDGDGAKPHAVDRAGRDGRTAAGDPAGQPR